MWKVDVANPLVGGRGVGPLVGAVRGLHDVTHVGHEYDVVFFFVFGDPPQLRVECLGKRLGVDLGVGEHDDHEGVGGQIIFGGAGLFAGVGGGGVASARLVGIGVAPEQTGQKQKYDTAHGLASTLES